MSIKTFLLILWAWVWVCSYHVAAKMDRTICAAYGAEYAGTSLMFDGYCRVSGIEVKAESLSWRN